MYPKKTLVYIFILLNYFSIYSQTKVSGTFSLHPNTEIRLKGFNGFTEKVFSNTKLSASGEFSLYYPSSYNGLGILEIKGQGTLLLILSNKETLKITAENINSKSSITIKNSPENTYLAQYETVQNSSRYKLEAWQWLNGIYTNEKKQLDALELINNEINRLQTNTDLFLQKIPEDTYTNYYLTLRNFIETRQNDITTNPTQTPKHIKTFMRYDLTDLRLENSGQMKSFYDGHFSIINAYYGESAKGKEETNNAIDHIIFQLNNYDQELLAVTEHLFKLFEQQNLFSAAEYLSLKMLAQNSCTLEGELERRFEQYRTMQEGNVAPNIIFEDKPEHVIRGLKNKEKSLEDIKSDYKLVVFWASWCHHCKEEMPKLKAMYSKLQERNVEIISISLDTDRHAFLTESAAYKWYSYCDFKKWKSPAALDYYIFATPTFYLLDQDNKILKKINSVAQIETTLNNLKN